MNKVLINLFITSSLMVGMVISASAQSVDYTVVYVPEEYGFEFVKMTTEADYVCMPLVKRTATGVNWLTNRILAVSPTGTEFAYLSLRNNLTNIFIKDIDRQGVSRQRTNRSAVVDFSYSPDGKSICFTEQVGESNRLFITDASVGYVCRQITSDNQDYSPVFSTDMKSILFCRMELQGASIWAYDMAYNYVSCFTSGQNPAPSPEGIAIFVARVNNVGHGEIWKVNIATGAEECILSSRNHSFFSPTLSPDGTQLLLVGSTGIPVGRGMYWNTDIFVCNVDGSGFQQLTYHAADDLSPAWSADGKFVYFISQRGSVNATPNVWRISLKERRNSKIY